MLTGFKIKKLVSKYAAPGTSTRDSSIVADFKEIGKPAILAAIEAFQQQKLTALKALFLLGEVCDQSYLKEIVPLIGDPYDEVRSVAKELIAKNWSKAATPLLIENLKSEDTYTRLNAAALLKSFKSDESILELVSLFNDATPETKECVIKIVGSIGGAISIRLALSALNDENWQVRQAAVQCLGSLQAPESIPTLLEKLDEKNPQIKILAMETLDAFDYRGATEQMLGLLTDRNIVVRQYATDCLIRIADKKTAPAIIELMKNPDVNIRRCAVEILKNLQAPNTTEVFMQALKDSDWWVRQVATNSLASLHGDTDITRGFISLTHDPDMNLRRCAVEYLNNVIDPAAFDALIERLDDEDWWVREKALRALGKLEDQRAIVPIAKLIDDKKTGHGVPRVLALLGGDNALHYLLRFLDEKPKQIRMETIKALGLLKNKNATDAIMQCQTDTDQEIASLATETLKNLTGRQFTNMATGKESSQTGRQGSQQLAPGTTIHEAFLILELDDSADSENHRYDDTFCLNMMKNMTTVVSPLIRQEQCQFSKGIDNGFIMTFPKATNAVRFAQNSLLAASEFNARAEEHEQIHLRFTIHCGEAKIGEQNDRIGMAMDMTLRIKDTEAKALIPIKGCMDPKDIPTKNRILVSEQVTREIKKMQGLQIKLVGLFELKGITGLHKIYSLT